MSVEYYWRRLSSRSVDAATASQLAEMVPHRGHPNFDPLRSAGLIMGVSGTADMIDFVLTAGRTTEGIGHLPVYGGQVRQEGYDDPEYGFTGTLVTVHDPSEVLAVARFLRDVDIDKRMRDMDEALVQMMDARGLSPWDAGWAHEVSTDLARLRQFYAGAADAGDAMVKWQSA
ncbi:hypothetical protein ACWERV_30100 [Streptomyces sp. NPDC004031]